MSRYRGRKLNSLNYEWKSCHILGCTIQNYTESIEGNELRMLELNYMENFGIANRIILNKCISNYCDYNTIKRMFTNNTVSKI